MRILLTRKLIFHYYIILPPTSPSSQIQLVNNTGTIKNRKEKLSGFCL